jgi:hypothetical protein
MKTPSDPWVGEGSTTLRQRWVAEAEQLINRKLKRVEQLMEDAQREEAEIIEAREMLQFLKAGSLNGRAPVQEDEGVVQDDPGPVQDEPKRYVNRADSLKVIESFQGRGFTTMEFIEAAGLKDRKSVVAKLRRGVEEGVLEQVRPGRGSSPTIWRASRAIQPKETT